MRYTFGVNLQFTPLGPKPLLFLTLFAINIPEIGVEVPLPCLRQGQVDTLLSRLTYLVSICMHDKASWWWVYT